MKQELGYGHRQTQSTKKKKRRKKEKKKREKNIETKMAASVLAEDPNT